MPKLAYVDQATGLPVRRPRPVRYEKAAPGGLVHVDIKKQGRIPDGGGHRKFGRTIGNRNNRNNRNNRHGGRGYSFLHHAVGHHSRLAYSEILDDERNSTRTNNPDGRTAKEQAEIRKYVVEAEPLLRTSAKLELDGQRPSAELADAVEQLIANAAS